jgi:site-specific recombinase XerC
MPKSHLKLITPVTEKRTVVPTRRSNADLRTREYLTEAEVERLLKATKGNRWAHRDATMILVAYRHGLRASEAADLAGTIELPVRLELVVNLKTAKTIELSVSESFLVVPVVNLIGLTADAESRNASVL